MEQNGVLWVTVSSWTVCLNDWDTADTGVPEHLCSLDDFMVYPPPHCVTYLHVHQPGRLTFLTVGPACLCLPSTYQVLGIAAKYVVSTWTHSAYMATKSNQWLLTTHLKTTEPFLTVSNSVPAWLPVSASSASDKQCPKTQKIPNATHLHSFWTFQAAKVTTIICLRSAIPPWLASQAGVRFR